MVMPVAGDDVVILMEKGATLFPRRKYIILLPKMIKVTGICLLNYRVSLSKEVGFEVIW